MSVVPYGDADDLPVQAPEDQQMQEEEGMPCGSAWRTDAEWRHEPERRKGCRVTLPGERGAEWRHALDVVAVWLCDGGPPARQLRNCWQSELRSGRGAAGSLSPPTPY